MYQYFSRAGVDQRKLPTAEIMLLLVAIFWGTSYGVTKEALVHTSVIAFLAIRFFMTTLLLVPLYIKDHLKGRAKDWLYAMPTGVILLAIFLSETYGVFNTTASNAAFLISLCVLMAPFVEWLVYKTYPGKKVFYLAVVCLFGVFLLTYESGSTIKLNNGDYFILLAALLRACMVVVTKKLMFNKCLSSICLTTLQSSVVAAGAIAILISTTDISWSLLPAESGFWISIVYLVAFCTIFSFFAQNYGVRNSSPSKASLLMGSEPAFGAIFACYWLGESLTPIQVLGGVLIFVATIFATLPSQNKVSVKVKEQQVDLEKT